MKSGREGASREGIPVDLTREIPPRDGPGSLDLEEDHRAVGGRPGVAARAGAVGTNGTGVGADPAVGLGVLLEAPEGARSARRSNSSPPVTISSSMYKQSLSWKVASSLSANGWSNFSLIRFSFIILVFCFSSSIWCFCWIFKAVEKRKIQGGS